jgi:hypothetical protein
MCIPFLYVPTHDSFELVQNIAALDGNNVRFMYTCLTGIFRLPLPLLESSGFVFDPIVH